MPLLVTIHLEFILSPQHSVGQPFRILLSNSRISRFQGCRRKSAHSCSRSSFINKVFNTRGGKTTRVPLQLYTHAQAEVISKRQLASMSSWSKIILIFQNNGPLWLKQLTLITLDNPCTLPPRPLLAWRGKAARGAGGGATARAKGQEPLEGAIALAGGWGGGATVYHKIVQTYQLK